MIPTSIDGTDITGATIDGTDVTEITVDGQTVFSATGLLEGFESGSLSTQYGGDTADFSVQSSTVFEGSFALEGTTGTVNSIARTDVNITRPGTYSVRVRVDTLNFNRRAGVFWMAQSATSGPDGYMSRIYQEDNLFDVFRVQNSSFNQIGTDSVSLNTNEWYEIEFEANSNGTENFRLFDDNAGQRGNQIAVVSTSDNTFSSGGIGFRDSSNGIPYFDQVKKL